MSSYFYPLALVIANYPVFKKLAFANLLKFTIANSFCQQQFSVSDIFAILQQIYVPIHCFYQCLT